ncbi:ef-1 guanine nucleotide exchange domain-containing [Plasmopara halstedii]|uniref:Ef-1 guanine nucleotide exchange domain-containing n=1 Tax=Plasmopara halstedii TaxID=4781 RepID=A0A0N7L7Q0_PLAHL|nr:ef-1 guanine nucleotide exchange domain-containing [Plasmopara halstedii]CEG47691.1 ef-1 guanine nucleotide exchange domain-containing [Plasmopara halstedii]|eukprot:XP_024584060.1 ef-1 guanine nucleotide exchange domain-containing [Plasmopara halstedii]
MGISFDNLDQDGGLKKLNGFLTSRSYIEGFKFSSADADLFHKFLSVPDAAKYANVYRWYVHVAARLGLRAILVTKKVTATTKAAVASSKVVKDDGNDDDDLFGDDDEDEDDEAAKALAAKRAEAAKAAKKEKKKPVERSQVVIEVKPWEAETDLEELAVKIKALPIEGLSWGEGHKLVPVAFGIKKLLVQCVIVDELVLLDDITEAIEAFEDYVQSVDIASMNKL